jgi:lipopolysaccharide/colanic/teichoic acid biosynthesis glycosyltransferase
MSTRTIIGKQQASTVIQPDSSVRLTLDLRRKLVGVSAPSLPSPETNGAGHPIVISEVDARENYDAVYRLLKRTMDLAFGLGPLFLVIAGLIKLTSHGPVFYKQERTGKDGERFLMYKFRTMVNGSDGMKQELEKRSHLSWPDFKMRNDPRVTGVGKVLRKFSLDEIPNFINIVKGDMSLVGPRPTSFRAEAYKDWQKLRLKAKPGLTGLQQVSGRANLQFDERVLLDIKYVLYQSLGMDIVIMLKTIYVVLSTKGSY